MKTLKVALAAALLASPVAVLAQHDMRGPMNGNGAMHSDMNRDHHDGRYDRVHSDRRDRMHHGWKTRCGYRWRHGHRIHSCWKVRW